MTLAPVCEEPVEHLALDGPIEKPRDRRGRHPGAQTLTNRGTLGGDADPRTFAGTPLVEPPR